MKRIDDKELNACFARLPLAPRLEVGPPATGVGVSGSGDSTGMQ